MEITIRPTKQLPKDFLEHDSLKSPFESSQNVGNTSGVGRLNSQQVFISKNITGSSVRTGAFHSVPAGLKLKIVKKSPTAEQLVNGENAPSRRCFVEGFGAAFDIWQEDRDIKRRMF